MISKLKITLLLKIFTSVLAVALIVILIAWFALPGYLIDYIEENDTEWINREISIEKVKLNPFTFVIEVLNAKVKEPNSSSDFVSFESLKVNLEFWPLIKSKINVEEVALTRFVGSVIQDNKHFNFSDLLTADSSNETKEDSQPIEFNIHNINVIKSSIHYLDSQLGSKFILDSIEIKDQEFTSKSDIFDAEVAFHQPEGGSVKGDVSYNLKNSDYEVKSHIESWELYPFKKYVTSVIRLNEFDGQIDSHLNISGNANTDFITCNGQVTVGNFKLTDPEDKPLMTIGRFFVDVKQINSQENIYDFKDILVEDSNIVFEYLPNGDNFTKWLVSSENADTETSDLDNHVGSEYYVSPFEMLSVYIYDMTKEYIFKSYTAEKILFSNFNLKFYDFTLEDSFFMDLTEVEIKSENIKPENQFAHFNVHGKMNRSGIVDGSVSVSRQGVENMDVNMNVKGLFLNRFSPYGRFYTAHQFLEGITSFSNKSVIKDSYLVSNNKLFVEQIKVSKKNKKKSGYSLPMRLAVGLMKDRDGNIDLEIPIEGPINDPKYKYGKVIWQVVKNLFTKIATSPFKALSNAFKVNEDDLKNIYFDNGQIMLGKKQHKSLNSIVKVLSKKEDVVIELNHLFNKEYEMDAIALKKVKLDYLKQSGLHIDSEIPIGKQAFDIPTSDEGFLEYLKRITPNYDETISVPENARNLLGHDFIDQELLNISTKQKEIIKDYLIAEKNIPENRFKIIDATKTDEAINQTRPKFEVKFGVN